MTIRSSWILLLFVLAGCAGSTPAPTADTTTSRAAAQAATAVAITGSRPTEPVRPVLPAAPTPNAPAAMPAQRLTPLPTATVGGRVAISRGDSIIVMEAAATRVAFAAAPGGSAKDPVWSPDGRQIAFAHAPPRATPLAGTKASAQDQLFVADIAVVDASGGPMRSLADHDQPGAILETPSWAPDGTSIYFAYYAPTYKGEQLIGETIEIRRKELAGGRMTTVVKDGSSPSVSPDGKSLVYTAESVSEGPSLRIIGVDGSGGRELVKPARFVSLLAPRFSPDGQTIAFSAAAAQQAGARDPLEALRSFFAPGLAYAHGLPWEIWTVPAAGGEARQVTRLAEDTPHSAWSSTGDQILVFGAGGLYLVDARSGNARLVSGEGAHGGMDWTSRP